MVETAEKIKIEKLARKVIKAQEGPQWLLLTCPADQILFGGARCGGKSYGLLLDWLTHQSNKDWGKYARGILFRRTMPEFEDIVEKSKEIFPLFKAKYNETKRTWVFKNGSKLKLRYLDKDKDADNYHGHEYSWMGFDELGSWASPKPIDKISACLRSAHIPARFLRWVASCNPGGKGHNWIKRRFVIPAEPFTIHKATIEFNGLSMEISRCFLPSLFADNKILAEKDPTYLIRITAGLPDYLAQAWGNGNWDITAGGMFDDAKCWDHSTHVIQPFDIPLNWNVNRSFDWGSSKPFSVGWWAESNGEEVKRADGSYFWAPSGTMIRIAEWYGCVKDSDDEGLLMTPRNIAKGIKHREQTDNLLKKLEVNPGPADSSIYSKMKGKDENSIAQDMEAEDVFWVKCKKGPDSRVNGWVLFREMLINSRENPMEKPGMFIFDTCRDFIRTIPPLPRDEKNMDDVDTTAEDHIADETRYQIMQRKHANFSGQAD